ncbi:MAG: isoleucine--tRNA ligase [Terriglobia bacterium]
MMKVPVELKNTLNLPRTAFPMKANLPQSEPHLLARWEQQQLYARLLEARAACPLFVLHDGPPYANGDVHLGTALNKILKDLVVRARSLAGFRTPFVPGWDCHGLPIEINVDRELGERKAAMSPVEVRQMCRDYAARFVELHRRDFKRLGCLGDWDHPYLTMSPDYEWLIADTFLTFLERGYVYKGLKPVLWCWYDRTALAEAEIEYAMRTSPSIWVRYRVVEEPPALGTKSDSGFYAIIWTTTPWTLPGSLALAFNPELRYALVGDDKGDVYIVAEKLIDTVARATGLRFTGGTVKSFPGSVFARAKFQHPFLARTIPGVVADYVTLEQGSGIVHTAPGHGAEDFETGQKYGLETYCPVDSEGRFTEEPFRGDTIWDANPKIIELLRARGNLVGDAGTIEHSYPHCWRCHNPLLFRATEQWFISLAHNQLRQRALEAIRKVNWIPPWGEERIAAMIATRPDWCISRQRVWGVPIPVFYCEACGEKFTQVSVLRQAVAWFKREGADAWYRHAAEDLLPQGTRCEHCGQTRFRKETDILDVWFDSGSSHLAVLGRPETSGRDSGLPWPADAYLEGPDQYRGWFHSSLLVALGVKQAAPYRQVVTHGWVLDADGRPMSKSLGNVIAPAEVWNRYGAELLRVVVVAVEYQDDMRISTALLDQLAEAYRKVRNTFRFCLANLYDFNPSADALPLADLQELDRWMLARTADLVARSRAAYETYAFHRVWHVTYNFCTVELSALYFDILKDRLYTAPARSPERRSAQTALYRIAHALARLLAPILCFTTEEVWNHLPDDGRLAGRRAQAGKKPASVHLALFPTAEELDAVLSPQKRNQWEKLFSVRTEVLKALERARAAKTIRSSLEAKLYLRADGELAALLARYRGALAPLFIVSHGQVELIPKLRDDASGRHETQPSDLPGLEIGVVPAEGKKCERCWNYSPQVGTNASYPTLCERCTRVLEQFEAA